MNLHGAHVKPGTLILQEKPFVYVLNAKLRTENCDYCFSKGELRKCSSCQYVYYCNKICQKDGWPIHKLECKQLKKILPKVVPDSARLLARLIKKLEKGGDMVKSFYAPNRFRKFKDLMSHYPNIKKDVRRMEHLMSLQMVLAEFLDGFMPNPAELMGIYGRMCINSFNISDEELKSLGTGIYLAASVLDHSCRPNVVAMFQGTTLNIRVTEEMPEFKWENLSLSYIDTLQLPKLRQEELLKTYYFLCQCPKCVDEEEARIMSGAACPNLNCDSYVEIKDEEDSHCMQCGTSVSLHFIQEYRDITEFTDLQLQNMKLAYLDVCKVCLNKHKGILYDLNIQHVRILDSAFEGSIDLGQWYGAVEHGLQLIPGYRKYLGEVHPLMGLLHLKLAKILIYQEKLQEAQEYLKNAFKILKITHGDTSVVFKNELMPLVFNNYSNCSFIRE